MKKRMKQLPRGIYERDGILYIRFKDENRKLVRESTKQSFVEIAEEILRKRHGEVAEGRYFLLRKFEHAEFGTLLDRWWEESGKHLHTCFAYLRSRIEKYFGKMKAREISSGTVQKFLNMLVEEDGYSPAYANSHRTMLNCIFNYCIRNREYDVNPVAPVPQLREKPRTRLLSLDEFHRLLKGCGDNAELKCFIILAALTTCRKSEILERRWADVHLEADVPYLEIPLTKNDDPKIVSLPAEAVELLRKLPSFGKDEYLFPARPTPLHSDPSKFKKGHRWDIRKQFVTACERAGIIDARLHDLRHLGVSVLLMKGTPDSVVRKLTGHRSEALSRYQHISPEFRAQTTELLAKVLLAGGSKKTHVVTHRPEKSQGLLKGNSVSPRESKGLTHRPVAQPG